MFFENEMSKNLHRRHLNESQRAMVGAKIKPLFEAEAKERQREHGDTAPGRTKITCDQLAISVQGTSRETAGASVNVSGTSVQRAKKVLDSGSDELIQAVEKGEIKLSAAAKLDHDIDFQQECLDWLEDFRGEEFIDHLEQLILERGPEEAIRRTFHPDQCDQTRKCYRAAIAYLANQLAPQTG